MKYVILHTKRFEKKIKKLDIRYVKNIRIRLNALTENPRPPGCKKLIAEDNIYRIRIGIYRVLYQVCDKELLVLALDVDHRSRIYDNH
jgi:mRNA interferase RelE/StbE